VNPANLRAQSGYTPYRANEPCAKFQLQNMNMKTTSNMLFRIPGVTTCAIACLLALPLASQAKDHKNHHHNQNQWNNNNGYNGQNNSGAAVAGFVLGLANGYAGRGYYYGPPNTAYYNQGPQIRYYATREAAPRAYYGYESSRVNSMDGAIQQALARAGYYNGPIDGILGPVSRQAIANYQADRGMRVTGTPSNSLINSLGLQ